MAVYLGLWLGIFIFGPDPTPFTATVIMIPFMRFEVAAVAARRAVVIVSSKYFAQTRLHEM